MAADGKSEKAKRIAAWGHDWRERLLRVLPVDPSAFSVAAGMRAATASALPVLAGQYTGEAGFDWMAIMGFWACLADVGGTTLSRALTVGSFSLFTLLGTVMSYWVQGALAPTVLLVLAWSFGGSLVRVWGNGASTVGLLLICNILINVAAPMDAAGLQSRLWFSVAGCAGAALMSFLLWRVHPHEGARKAVARCWRRTAELAAALRHIQEEDNLPEHCLPEHDWGPLLREQRNAVRQAIETARDVMAALRRRQAGRTDRGGRLLLIVAELDRIFAAMIALSDVLETAEAFGRDLELRAAIRAALGRLALGAHRFAEAIEGDRPLEAIDMTAAIATLRERLKAVPEQGAAAYAQVAELLQTMQSYLSFAAEAAKGVSLRDDQTVFEPEAARRRVQHLYRQIRANLSVESLAFRHAARLAITGAVAVGLTSFFQIERGYWVTITSVVVLQPYLATTFWRTVERVAGSVMGGVAAALVGLVIQGPLPTAIVIFPITIGALAFRGVNYTVFVFFVTAQFVLIAELFQTGTIVPSYAIAAMRALLSLVGGLLGLAAAYFIFPVPERRELPRSLARAMIENRNLVIGAIDRLLGGGAEPEKEMAQRHRRAGIASNNAEASLQRLLDGPHGAAGHAWGEPAMTIVTCLRRAAGVAVTLDHLKPQSVNAEERMLLDAIRAWLATRFETLAAAAGQLRPLAGNGSPLGSSPAGSSPATPSPLGFSPADLAEAGTRQGERTILGHEIARLCRQIDLMADAVTRIPDVSRG